mmetsp:Transcript_23505/g.74488  ORF Transcript_23505/g.74488 Transcript_23505/m.74488 type:complete len:373 (+) Transcript_23505:236-1354(+)
MLAIPFAEPPLLEELPEAEQAHVLVQLARAAPGGGPRVVLGRHGEGDHPEREGVGEVRVVLGVRVHLGSLVGLLAADLSPAPAREGDHSEVDDLHLQLVLLLRQQDVLQREVAVRDAKVMQPPHARRDLPHDRLHGLLARAARLGVAVAPAEEVAPSGQARDHVGVLLIAEDVEELAGKRVADLVQLPHDAQVVPGLLGGGRVVVLEVLGGEPDPLRGHPLDGHLDAALGLRRPHQVDPPVVPYRLLELRDHGVSARVPVLDRLGDLLHRLLQHGRGHLRHLQLDLLQPHHALAVPPGLAAASGGRAAAASGGRRVGAPGVLGLAPRQGRRPAAAARARGGLHRGVAALGLALEHAEETRKGRQPHRERSAP